MSTFSNISNNPSNWYIVTDQVMGGKSELEASFDDGVFSLNGYVTTVNNGGFVRLDQIALIRRLRVFALWQKEIMKPMRFM